MNIVDLSNIQITQIHARHVEKFVEVFQADDGTWRCVLELKNGMKVPGRLGITLNELQLSKDLRMRLYAHISTGKKVALPELKTAPETLPEAIQSTPATSPEQVIDSINPQQESKPSTFKTQSNFKTRKI